MSTAHRPTRLKRTLATSAGLALTLGCMTVLPAGAAIVPQPVSHAAQDAALGLTPVGTYETGQFDESAAEIVAHHAATSASSWSMPWPVPSTSWTSPIPPTP